jgi:hypothetical protein
MTRNALAAALALALAPALAPSLAFAANPPQLIGDWKGVLDIGGQKLTLIWHVAADQVVVDSPDQNSNGLPGAAGTNGSAYTLSIPIAGANFEGKLSEDGKTLSGEFYQGGASPSLTLTRTSATPTLPTFKPAPAEIRGDWQGTLSTPNGSADLAFHLAEKSTVDVPGAGPLPASVEKTGEDYTISLAAGVFKGKLSADGKTLAGALGQGGQAPSLPLTLTRK